MKKILLRLDLNVPLRNGRIIDDYKLRRSLPTVQSLRRKGAVIIVTHLGDSKSTRPLQQWLEKGLKRPVRFIHGGWNIIAREVAKLQKGEIAIIENIRRFPGEMKNDVGFAKQLAALATEYVNDAFAVSHRKHASVSAVKKFLPSSAGPLLKEEVRQLTKAKRGRKPIVVVIGGAKISTKQPLIKVFSPRAVVLVGGDVANSLLQAKKGRKKNNKNIILPDDTIDFKGKAYDIGPKTIERFENYLRKAKTIIWNGPMGVFEKKGYEKGTKAIARAIELATKKGAFSVVGGGETINALGKNSKYFSWVSTGGGATLSFLSDEVMPGLEGIIKK